MCFNSLQTGKCIQRLRKLNPGAVVRRVSIPFKRESVSKAVEQWRSPFLRRIVSIPFKRESVSKAIQFLLYKEKTNEVSNSLQTGKVYPKNNGVRSNLEARLVSIPFKRESVSKDKIVDHVVKMSAPSESNKFQFPSNGKVYPKYYTTPFDLLQVILFQFPSNGKVYPKSIRLITQTGWVWLVSFNSLQTGKCIQRILRPRLQARMYKCFNSLQTGKCIQRKSQRRKTC